MALPGIASAGELKGLEYLKLLFAEKKEKESEIKGLKYLKHLFDEQQELDLLVASSPSSARVHDWSELTRDINNLIGDKLRFFPHLQKFGVACKEWRGITNEIIKPITEKIKNEPPMLLLPYNHKTQIATFLEIKNFNKYNMKMPELKDQWICGASNGWLAMTDDNFDLFIFNPLTRVRIKLPPQDPSTIDWFREEFPPKLCRRRPWCRKWFISKVVLSGDPSSSNCMVAIIYHDWYWLGVCRLGDQNWSVTNSYMGSRNWRGYDDVIFFQERIFAVTHGLVHVFDYSRESGLSFERLIPRPDHDANGSQLKKHLIEFCGELLLVFRFCKSKKYRQTCRPQKTWKFEVFKLNVDMNSWDKVKSLGNRSLFLGLNDSISVSAKEFPWCKRNCIYFMQDSRDDGHRYGHQWDNGVFSLKENRVIKKFDIEHSLSHWLAPALWFRAKGLQI